MTALRGITVGLVEHADVLTSRPSLVHELVPTIRRRGAQVRVVLDHEPMRLDTSPEWDVTLLRSGSQAALHLAAAAEGFGICSLNGAEATRLAQDKLATTAVLARAGLPLPPAWLVPLDASSPPARELPARRGEVLLRAAGGSGGAGLWRTTWDALPSTLTPRLPSGAYVATDLLTPDGDHLKVLVAGSWVRAIRRPFPARTLEEKRGRAVIVPADVRQVARRAGTLLGLRCYACDFVATPDAWRLVDVDAFPGYKGADGAAEAIAAELERLIERVA
jgi:ribosomal protein S6--L-glutamate ligase